MNKELISIVVPVYNVEEYLDRCITSIVNQTYKKLEIILVDDGSPDNSLFICDKWAKQDKRIKVIHKENSGLGMARNTGISEATGKYIFFIDSDDYVDSHMVEECYREAEKEKADIVCFGNDRVTQNGVVISKRIPKRPKQIFSDNEIIEKMLPMALFSNTRTIENWNLSLSACFSMFSMSLFKDCNIRFVSEREIISEDFYTIFNLYKYIKKAVIIDKVFYHYFVNAVSLTHKYREDRFEKIKIFYYSLLASAKKFENGDVLKEGVVATFLGLSIGALKQIVMAEMGITKKYEELKKIVVDETIQQAINNYDFSYENISKKTLFWSIKNKYVIICYYLVWLRNLKE